MLTSKQREICLKTISSNTFYALVMDALEAKKDLSVVRMADGEKKLYGHVNQDHDGTLMPFGGLTEDWLKRYGCYGIPKVELWKRLLEANRHCTYFAPSVSGLTMPAYDVYGLFPERDIYVDNFFPNLWNNEQKTALLSAAKRVTFIHGSIGLGGGFIRRAKNFLGVEVTQVHLTNWDQSDEVIRHADMTNSPLTLLSTGPACKMIGPRLKGVSLDIGQAAERWSLQWMENK